LVRIEIYQHKKNSSVTKRQKQNFSARKSFVTSSLNKIKPKWKWTKWTQGPFSCIFLFSFIINFNPTANKSTRKFRVG